MIAWFLIAIGTVAFFAYIAVNGVTTVDTLGSTAGRAETIRRIDTVAVALMERASPVQSDGVIYAPAGMPGTSEYLLPEELQASAITSFGAKFQYCPMGAALDTANETVSYPGGSYGIRTAALNGKRYVVTGRIPGTAGGDPNVIGFVVAPVRPDAATPGCGQITRSGDLYTAPNGIVRAVRRSQAAEDDISRNSDGVTWYVTPNGGGSGSSWSSPATITDAVAAYRQSPGGTFSIRMAAGTHRLASGALDQTQITMLPKRERSSLSLVGANGTTLSTGAISVPSDFEMRNITAADSAIVANDGHSVTITQAVTGSLVANRGSSIIARENNTIYGSPGVAAAIQVIGGSKASFSNALTVHVQPALGAISITGGSKASIQSATVNLQPLGTGNRYYLIGVETGSALSLNASTLNVNASSDYAFLVGGALNSQALAMNVNVGTHVAVQTTPGASVKLLAYELQGALPPNYGFASQNAYRFQGYGNVRAGTRCWWQGDSSLHRYSSPGITGARSAVSADEGWAQLVDPMTPQQVADYQAMRQRNLERLDIRTRTENFDGNFVCQQAAAPSYTTCANEGGYCTLPANARPHLVRYGIGNSWVYMVTSRGIPCTNEVFTDPISGTPKICQYTS